MVVKFLKAYWIFGVVAVLIIGGTYYFFFFNKSQPNQTKNIRSTPTESVTNPEITPESTPTSTPTPSSKQVTKTTTPIPNGPPQGQIVGNYQVPVGPTTYGTVDISATWKNLTIGKNGLVQAAVCVAVNGQTPALMSLDNSPNGSWENSVPWLAPNSNYTFSLYDDHGGDLANCAGTVLSSFQINTMLPSVFTPGP